MMIRVTRLAALCAALVVSATACERIPDTVKIGAVQPLTGPSAAKGVNMLNGVQLAVDEIDARGLKIKGKPVFLELVKADDKSNVEEGKKVD